MKIVHSLGHNHNWNIESYYEQEIGDEFLITAFTFGADFESNKRIVPILEKCWIDLQFYGKKASGQISSGKLSEFSFHPANIVNEEELTNIYIQELIEQAIKFQEEKGFKKIIIPHYYEDTDSQAIIAIIKTTNRYLKSNGKKNVEYFMTLPFAYDIIRDNDKVNHLLIELTDMDIVFDGYFIACENKPEQGQKISRDSRLISNLSKVLRILKIQGFKTFYAYANWDAIVFLAQTDIDYISIGTYENLRNFSNKRFTEDISGGASDGYYFSEKMLNMVRAKDLKIIRELNALDLIRNERNIFSEIILQVDFKWNIHKPDVNKNYLLSVSRLLKKISDIDDNYKRTFYVLCLIQRANETYEKLNEEYILLQNEGRNYHLSVWQTQLLKSIGMKPDEFLEVYNLT